jgi:metallophosphoesterase (TIGR00282 family)
LVILCIGDICGRPGRTAVSDSLERLREEFAVDFVIANGENAAAGFGITSAIARDLLDVGVDCLTSGNHCWAQKESYGAYDAEARLLRPANFPPGAPGRGSGVYEVGGGAQIGVLNLVGRVFLDAVDCPFQVGEAELEGLRAKTPVVIVDMHAEATSEKLAMAHCLDGRVSAIVGTHTHVQTADERILPGGTAYITDIGMTGARNSIIGVTPEPVLRRFVQRLPARFEPPKTGPWVLQGVVVRVSDRTGKGEHIERITRVQGE